MNGKSASNPWGKLKSKGIKEILHTLKLYTIMHTFTVQIFLFCLHSFFIPSQSWKMAPMVPQTPTIF